MNRLIICAGQSESFDFAKPMGIGLIEMSINLSIYLQSCITNSAIVNATNPTKKKTETILTLPNEIIFVGSAGLYKDGQLFEIFESKNAANIEISLLDDKSYIPFPQEVFNDVSRETFINSSNFITKNIASATKFFELGAYAENMEFYSVLAVARKFNIPAYGIFVATNFCNANAHNDFITNHNLAKDILHDYLESKGII